MTSLRIDRKIARPIVITILGLALSIAWYLTLHGAWTNPSTQISSFSLLAYLAIVCSSFILVEYRVQDVVEQTVFHAPLLFFAIFSMARAILAIFGIYIVPTSLDGLLSLLFQMLVFGILVLHSAIRRRSGGPKHRTQETVTVILIGVLLVVSFALVRQSIPIEFQQVIGLILGFGSGTLIVVSGVLWMQARSTRTKFDSETFVPGFFIFGISWMPLAYALFVPTDIWTLALSLQAIGLVLLAVGTAIPFFVKSGAEKRYAMLISIGIQSIAILPLFITYVAASIYSVNPFAGPVVHIITHLGAAVLAVLFAVLTAIYNAQRFHFKRYPLIAAFLVWAVVDTYQFMAHLLGFEFLVNSILPYAVGTVFTMVLLPLAIHWTNSSPRSSIIRHRQLMFVGVIIGVILSIILGEIFQNTVVPATSRGLYGRVIVLTCILFVMFSLIFLLSMQLRLSPEKMTVDRVSIGFLMPWIIPTLIRASFGELSVGWGFADLTLLLALLVGPSILGVLYLREMNQAEELKKKASYYSDLLVHDISNCHQALELSIGLLESSEVQKGVKKQALDDAQVELLRAERLIANVRRLAMADELTYKTMHDVDLVLIVQSAYSMAHRNKPDVENRITINGEAGVFHALASNLLIDALINLFDAGIHHAPGGAFWVSVEDSQKYGKLHWDLVINAFGWKIEPALLTNALELNDIKDVTTRMLGLTVVKNLIEAVGGRIQAKAIDENDMTTGTVFTISLKKS